jgi:hypothetical protein
MGVTISAQVRLDAVIVAADRFLTNSDMAPVIRYRSPHVCCVIGVVVRIASRSAG